MRKVGLFAAKQTLSALVDRATRGEKIGITRHGKLAAYIVPAEAEVDLRQVFERIEAIRKRARSKKGLTTKQLIEEGRM